MTASRQGQPTGRSRGILFHVLVLVCVALALEALCGVYHRWYVRRIGGFGLPPGLFVARERLGFGMRPGFEGAFTLGAFRGIAVRINGDGYRDRPFRAPGDRDRIALVGDSVVFGVGVRAEDVVDARLEEILAAGSGAVSVLNLGVTAYTLEHYLVQLREDVPRLRPRLTLVGLCVNDIEGPAGAWPLAAVTSDPNAGIRRWSDLVWVYSHVRKLLRMPHSAGFRTPAEQWKTSFAKTMELWSRPERIAALEAGLDRLAAVGSTPGTVPVLAVLWPTSFELRRPEGPWGRPRAFLREELAARGIPYVDLFDGFAAAGSPERLYLPDDPMHFGPEGHRLAARLLAAELADRPAADHLAREAPR